DRDRRGGEEHRRHPARARHRRGLRRPVGSLAHDGLQARLDQTDAPVVEAQLKIVEACKRHGVAAGIHNGTAAYALKMIAAGYQFVTLASESRFMAAKAAEEVAAVRKTGVKAGKLPAY